jgi:uncharacterized protein (TIGR03083 family)
MVRHDRMVGDGADVGPTTGATTRRRPLARHTRQEFTGLMDYWQTIRTESARFGELVRALDGAAPVPTCPGWSVADLTYHLAEVQDHWARVVRGADGSTLTPLRRPADLDLPDTFEAASARLLEALAEADPAGSCWSWHPEGGSIAWALRRQAHEALIHRVDAEAAAGLTPAAPAEPGLAADGVDEVLTVMVAGVPEWGRFTPDGRLLRVRATEQAVVTDLTLRLGRFTGTGPESGTEWDLAAAETATETAEVDRAPVVQGDAWGLDLWLWGRGPLPVDTATDADPALLAELRELLVEATQ